MKENAVSTNSAPKNAARLRRERSTDSPVASAVSAASEAPIAANAPKWWVHFVGVRVIASSEMAAVPISRRPGPRAAPGMPLRRSDTTRQVPTQSSSTNTGKRLASEPPAPGSNSCS